MKKIFDWTIGSFFRTFGRIIAFIVIGAIVVLLAEKSGIKLPDVLGIGRVYADENFSYSSSLWNYTYSTLNDCSVSGTNCTINGYGSNVQLDTTKNVNYINTLRFYTYATDSNKFKSSNYYNFKFEVCQSEKDFNSIKSRGRGYSWGYNTTNAATGSTSGDPTELSYKIDDIVEDNSCYYITFSVKPPVDSRYIGFWFTYTGYGDNTSLAVIPDIDYFNYTGGSINVKSLSVTYSSDVNATINNATNQIINNQNENTQTIINSQTEIKDSVDELNDTILDDNISDNEYSNALNINTGNDTSFGPFSGFLMLPLTWIQTLLVPNDSCQVINLPLPYMENKYLTLPCMDEFWGSLGGVADLISLVWIAVVGVRIFNGLYVLTIETTSSEANAEHLYKIRSWEL